MEKNWSIVADPFVQHVTHVKTVNMTLCSERHGSIAAESVDLATRVSMGCKTRVNKASIVVVIQESLAVNCAETVC